MASKVSLKAKALGGVGALGAALAIAALAPATASAAPVACIVPPGAAPSAIIDALSQCGSTADATSAAASFALNGLSSAQASVYAAALALGINGGNAMSIASGGAGPAAIALGPGATATATGTLPGLSIAIAPPGSNVSINSATGAVCDGPGLAGDFATLKGCIRLN